MAMNNITKVLDLKFQNVLLRPNLKDGLLSKVPSFMILVQVQGLEKCEQLQKLDLTLNFVDLKNLPFITSLNANVHLTEL